FRYLDADTHSASIWQTGSLGPAVRTTSNSDLILQPMRPASESRPSASWVAGGARSAESGAPVPCRIVDPPCLHCLTLGSFGRFSKGRAGFVRSIFKERRGSSVGRGSLDAAREPDRRSPGATEHPILDRSHPLDRCGLLLGSFGRFRRAAAFVRPPSKD